MAATLLIKPDINDVKLASKSSTTPSITSVFEEGLFDLSPQLRIRPTIHQSRPPKELLILSPKAEGKYPVIIFLHGFSLSNSYYTDLLKHIASHGYIIVAPQLYNMMPVPAWSSDGEMKSTAAVADWLPKGLQSVLSENNGKAEADLLNLVLMGHSRGGKTAFSLAVDHNMTSLKFKALVGIDPVAGLSTGMQIRPHILTKHPDSINVGYPVMIIGTGLGSEKPNFFTPGCAPDGLNHINLYYETKPTCYHFVTKDYGHMDMLDDSFKSLVGTMATVTCKGGKGSLDLLRRCMGGLVVAFLGNYMYGKPEDLEAILLNPELAPVTLDPVEFKKFTSHSS